MSEETSDAEAIAASDVDPEHFAVLYDRHSEAISAYLRRRLRVEVADELTAETFLTAFRLRNRFDATHPSARPWLFGIAANLLRRHARTERRELRAYARAAADQPRAECSGETQHERGELGPELAEGLAALSSKDREVLLLCAWAELSYEEIAQALEIPVGTVRSRLSRARQRVRELLPDGRAIEDSTPTRTRSAR